MPHGKICDLERKAGRTPVGPNMGAFAAGLYEEPQR